MDPQNKFQTLTKRIEDLLENKDPENIEYQIKDLTQKSAQPDFWNDSDKAGKIMSDLGSLKDELSSIKEVQQKQADIKTLFELQNEGENVEKDIEGLLEDLDKLLDKMELETYLSNKFDKYDAIFSIHAGQGGTEAQDWAEMLERMYLRFFESRGWKTDIIDRITGEEAGIKSVTLEVHGRFAYGYLKGEHGTHRLVRVSPFNAQGLRQTSFAGVEVAPLIEDDIEVDLKDEDIEFTAVRSSGPGGQSVNKTSSAVRLTHKPTGISVAASTHKSQLQNRKQARNLLKAKLYQKKLERQEKEINKETGDHKIAGWGNQIRNYVLNPYKLVKDLRTGIETDQVEAVLDGDLEEFIEAGVKIS